MPRYCYVCDNCGLHDSEIVPMFQRRTEVPCACGAMMRQDFSKAASVGGRAFHKPIEMYSVAPNNPQEVAAFQRRNPDVKMNDQLVPIAHNRAEKLRILKNEGFEEHS